MATKPRATTTVSTTAGASSAGLDVLCLFAPVPTHADMVPRLFGTAAAIFEYHGYADAIDYAAMHYEQTRKPILFCGLPIATPGVVGRHNKSGNTGSSVTTVAVGGSGCLGEHDGIWTVETGGTIGTSQIVLKLSMDGGRSEKRVRLGTATSYVDPYFGITTTFAAGTLVAGDVIHTWHGTSPRSDATGWATARANLAAQQKQFRSILLIGDLQNDTEASAFTAQLNAYETANERFVYGRASVLDRLPLATMSHDLARMTGTPALTFAEVGASGDTITRATGSWLADGFVVGDTIVITGATASAGANNITAVIASLSATVITLGTEDLAAEVTSAASIVAYPTLTFAEVGASGDTITRNRGSWLADGFRVGDLITSNSGSNDFTAVQGLAAVTATVLTLGTDDVAAEVVGTHLATITAGQTKAVWMAAIDAEFAPVDDEFRIDLSAGRGAVLQPFTLWNLRRPAAWAASLREYAHDLHVTTWRKDGGPTGFNLYDTDDNLVEWDDNIDGAAASAARFTSFRSWSNGPNGAFLTLSLTRAGDASILSYTHNVAVVNLACSVCQATTENAIGRTPLLNADGTAQAADLAEIAAEVNAALKQQLLANVKNEGQRATSAKWTPSSDDILNVPEATLTGVLDINLRGTIHSVNTKVRVQSGG